MKIDAVEMEVVDVRYHSSILFTLELKMTGAKSGTPIAYKPGQFVQLQVPSVDGILLRRPFSIYYTREDVLGLLIQIAGKGTRALAEAATPGARFSVVLPLGNHFSTPAGQKALLIGGGVGIAPLFSLGQSLKEQGVEVSFLLGARDAGAFPDLTPFGEVGELYITTEDASLGEKGFVTDHTIMNTEHLDFSQIYTCGPTPMMRAVAQYAIERGIPCEASLENHMACGFGVCLCCVEPTIEGHQRVCVDGPVFDVKELTW
ncbi:MAG: dihydroorotate dehydrogenase electron transfer subunit [Porphyromonas sp.]|nr:dihydroorotate dehydrogenase electron transfer subunit [Porphyromonas sp.]